MILATIAQGSKLAFYLCGGALVVWAVVLSAIGISRPEFPGSAAAGRMVMGLSIVLAAAAMATGVITS